MVHYKSFVQLHTVYLSMRTTYSFLPNVLLTLVPGAMKKKKKRVAGEVLAYIQRDSESIKFIGHCY